MRYLIVVAVVLALAGFLVLTTNACGGGGTAVVFDPLTLFSGTYCAGMFMGNAAAAPDEGTGFWGTWAGNGAGMTNGGGAVTLNRNGAILGPVPSGGLAYTIDANNMITLLQGGSALYQGGVSSDGSLLCWASVATMSSPLIAILGRKQGTHTDASLSGLYHLVAFFYNHAGMQNGCWFGTATFDGAGMGSTMTTINLNGNVGVPVMNPATYSVAGDGTVTGTFLTGQDLQGAILAGGELVILSGSTTGGQVPMLVVLIKGSAGNTNASINGSYSIVVIGSDTNPPPVWRSLVGDAAGDGTGTVAIPSVVRNDDGTITSGSAGVSVLTVNPDGSFGGAVSGAISQSGRVAVLTTATTMGDDPDLWFFLRR